MTRLSGRWRQVLLGALAAVLVAMLLIVAARNDSKKTDDHASAKRIVAEVLKQAGPSRAPTGSFITSLPYDASIPAKVKPVYVGDSIIYENFMSHSSLLARPTANGHEGFIYIAGSKAPKSFTFSFHLLPGTQLAKEPDSSVSVVDTVSKARPTIIKDVKAATITPAGTSVRLDLNLKSPKYPVVVKYEYMDPTPALVEGRVPAIKEVRSETDAKTVRPLQNNQGKYFAAKDGLVIHLTGASTLRAVNYASGLDKGDNLDPTVQAAMVGTATDVAEALRSAKIQVEDKPTTALKSAVLKDNCLTATIPPGGLDEFIDRYAVVWSGQQAAATELPQPENMSLTVDPCEKPPAKAATKKPAPQPNNPPRTNPPMNPALLPQVIGLDMDLLCRNLFGPGASAVVLNPNNRDSWACNHGGERSALEQKDMQIYCNYTLIGSRLVALGDRPSDWRCQLG